MVKKLPFHKNYIMMISKHKSYSIVAVAILLFWGKGILMNDKVEGDWQKPVQYYAYPDTSVVRPFSVDVHDGLISTVQTHYDSTGGNLNYSEVFFLQKEPGSNPEISKLTSGVYLAEQPVIFRSHSGHLHIFWGERRIDPFLKEFEIGNPEPFAIATSLIYTRVSGGQAGEPEQIYEGGLSVLGGGVGDLWLPIHIAEDTNNQLHIAVRGEGNFEDFDGAPGLVYIKRDSIGEWNSPRFLLPFRLNTNITSYSEDHLAVVYPGAGMFSDQGGNNDIFVITSDNGGDSWSDQKLIFTSGEQNVGSFNLEATNSGNIHLVWGRYMNSGYTPFPEEIWHSYSDDKGRSWSEPNLFFKLERSSGNEFHYMKNMDMEIDPSGRVHLAGVSRQGFINEEEENLSLYYSSFDPLHKSWGPVDKLDFVGAPNQVELELDEVSNELYIFWEEKDESLHYSKKELDVPITPPVGSPSGPLQVHANYPNPFDASTTIPFTLDEAGDVTLIVYDIGGRKLLQKDVGYLPEGFHNQIIEMESFSSGTYIYELIIDGIHRQQEKMVIVK